MKTTDTDRVILARQQRDSILRILSSLIHAMIPALPLESARSARATVERIKADPTLTANP